METGFSERVAFDFIFSLFFTHVQRGEKWPLRRVNQGAQGRIDGLLVREILSPVR